MRILATNRIPQECLEGLKKPLTLSLSKGSQGAGEIRHPVRLFGQACHKQQSLRSGGEQGFILPTVLLLFVLGLSAVIPLLTLTSTGLRSAQNTLDRDMAVLAAEGAIQRVTADLIRGADAIPSTYETFAPHLSNQPYNSYTLTTSYTSPSVNVNDLPVSISIASPATDVTPPTTQQYMDPGLADPNLKTLPAGYGYVVRIYNVRQGVLQVNWAYSPAGTGRIGVWLGIPENPRTGTPYVPGLIDSFPRDPPVLDTGNSPGNATYVRTNSINVEPGVYTIVFDNTRGQNVKNTTGFAPSGGPNDTWVYVNAGRDYRVTATAGGFSVVAFLRQFPGYTEPGSGIINPNFPTFITNSVFIRSWKLPE